MNIQPPWTSGAAEILKHGLSLLKKDNDVNRRLAMISIDNAVELMIKTYLGLPKRVSGLSISRSDYQSFSESFPKLLDALENHASSKISGIDLGEIEWYHRLRNQLYHQGNGLTVERDKVEVYSELANVLFENLFGYRLIAENEDETLLLGLFMQAWVDFEKTMSTLSETEPKRAIYSFRKTLELMVSEHRIFQKDFDEILRIQQIRNQVVHGVVNHKDVINSEMIKKLKDLTANLLASN